MTFNKKEYMKEYNEKYYQEHLGYWGQWRETHPDQVKEACHKWYSNHLGYWHPRNLRHIRFLDKRILTKNNPRSNICSECGRGYPLELKTQTSLHHDIYDLENPTAYTRELCSSCHALLHWRIKERLFKPVIIKGKERDAA